MIMLLSTAPIRKGVMFDLKDPNNKKAFLTGYVVGDSLKKEKRQHEPQPDLSDDGSAIGYLIGILISAIVIVVAYVVLMR